MANKTLVTGGAGFIGSHLVDALMTRREEVRVLDNLSTGSIENVKPWMNGKNFEFIRGDLLNQNDTRKAVAGCDTVYHLAANPEVRISSTNPYVHFQNNILATFNLLEAIRKSGIDIIVFSSSSTVYGEASKIPTPEDYAPLMPISVYGASKLACEGLIMAYAHTYGFRAIILRLANVIGPRTKHGVIYDFIIKLRRNPKMLEVLGDGSQTKSYLHVDDCIEAFLLTYKKCRSSIEVLNVGSEDQITVRRIAEIVAEVMGLKDIRLEYTDGVNGGRGWKGDVKNMLLDISKLKALGWAPRFNSEEAVRKTAISLLTELGKS